MGEIYLQKQTVKEQKHMKKVVTYTSILNWYFESNWQMEHLNKYKLENINSTKRRKTGPS